MSDDDLNAIREAGKEIGRILAKLEELAGIDDSIRKRVGRIENGILFCLCILAGFWLKSVGIIP